MARKVNTAFVGSTEEQTDPGAHAQTLTLGGAVGDTALVHDILTGDNSPTTPIDHTGSGAGVPLGLPLCNTVTVLGASDGVSVERKRHSSASSVVVNNAYLFFLPVYLPDGETSIHVRIGINDPDGLYMVCRSSADFTEQGESGQVYGEGGGGTFDGRTTGLTGGTVYLVGVRCRLGPLEPTRTWDGFTVYFPSSPISNYATVAEYTNASLPQVDVATAAGGSSSEVLSLTDWDASMFADDIAIHSQLTDRLSQNQHALAEFLTGAPAGGNAAYTLVSSAGADPASSAFHDHSLSTHTAEEEIDFVVAAEPLGACLATLTGASDHATDTWGAPQSRNTTVDNDLVDIIVHMPDFPDSLTASRLRLAVLTSNAGKSTVTVKAQTYGATSGAGTARSGTASAIGSTTYGYVVLGGVGGASRIDFDGGEPNRLVIMTTDSDGGATNSARFLGYCWFFDRDS